MHTKHERSLEPTLNPGVAERIADDDLLGVYITDAGKITHPGKEEVVSLFSLIYAGRESQHILDSGQELSKEDELFHLNAADQGNKAREEMILRNRKLVIKIATSYSGTNIDFMELIQEGNIGLIQAVDRFDTKKKKRFSTFADWWVRKYMRTFIKEHYAFTNTTIDLQTVYDQEEDKHPVDSEATSEEEILDNILLEHALNTLDDRRYAMVVLRHGLGWTYVDIGKQFGIVSQTAKEVIDNALVKVRENPQFSDLPRAL